MSIFQEQDQQGRATNTLGYSQDCHYSPEQQIHLVAEYHANRIKAERIAFRTGIDIAFVKQLINGEIKADYFERLCHFYRRRRRNKKIRESHKLKSGTERIELQQQIEHEYQQSLKQ